MCFFEMTKVTFSVRFGCIGSLIAALSVWSSVGALAASPNAPQSLPALTAQELSEFVGGPTLISLHLKNVALREAVVELSRQSKVAIEAFDQEQNGIFWKQQKALVTVDVESVPFWTAARAITPADGSLVWSLDRNGRNLQVRPDTGGAINFAAPSQQLGLFSIVAAGYQRHIQSDLFWNFSGRPDPVSERTEKINFDLWADPKLFDGLHDFQLGGGAYSLEEVVDDTGQQLGGNKENFTPVAGLFPHFGVEASFQPPAANAHFLKTVRGQLRFQVATKTANWEATLANGAAQAEHEFEITDDSGQTKTLKITAKVAPYGQEKTDFQVQLQTVAERFIPLAQLPIHSVRLEDAAGNSIVGIVGSRDSRQWQANYHTALRPTTGAPVRLIISLPTQFRWLKIPFEFHDLPLPPTKN